MRRRRNNAGKLSSIGGAVLLDIRTAANEIKKERARKKDTHEKKRSYLNLSADIMMN